MFFECIKYTHQFLLILWVLQPCKCCISNNSSTNIKCKRFKSFKNTLNRFHYCTSSRSNLLTNFISSLLKERLFLLYFLFLSLCTLFFCFFLLIRNSICKIKGKSRSNICKNIINFRQRFVYLCSILLL